MRSLFGMLMRRLAWISAIAWVAACSSKPTPVEPSPAEPAIENVEESAAEAEPWGRVAVVLLFDRSGSMSGPKLESAKAGARAALEALHDSAILAVVAFDQQPVTLVPLTRVSTSADIQSGIDRLVAGGGTDILPGVKTAYELLYETQADVKHVVLLSDGQAPYDGMEELVTEMHANGITITSVAIGDADPILLSIISDKGGGRLYIIDDLDLLPRVYADEMAAIQKQKF